MAITPDAIGNPKRVDKRRVDAVVTEYVEGNQPNLEMVSASSNIVREREI